MERLDVGNREIQGREGRSGQVRVLPWTGGMPRCFPVVQVDGQAGVVPSAADARVRRAAARVRARGAPPKAPRRDVGRIGLVGLAGMGLEFLPAVGARQAVLPHDAANPAPADRFARPSQRRLYLARAVATAARSVDRQHVGLDGIGQLRRVCQRAHGVAGRARNAEDLALRRYRAAAGVRRHRRRFRANIGAACFKASTSMRSLRLSRSSSMALAWSGVRLSAARGDPAAFIDAIHLRTVDLPRPYSATIPLMGLPALRSSTICRLKSSLKCRGCLGLAIVSSVRNGLHGTVQLGVANPLLTGPIRFNYLSVSPCRHRLAESACRFGVHRFQGRSRGLARSFDDAKMTLGGKARRASFLRRIFVGVRMNYFLKP